MKAFGKALCGILNWNDGPRADHLDYALACDYIIGFDGQQEHPAKRAVDEYLCRLEHVQRPGAVRRRRLRGDEQAAAEKDQVSAGHSTTMPDLPMGQDER